MKEYSPQTAIKIGEMPRPYYYARERPGKPQKRIGVETFSSDGEIRRFFFWRNFHLDLSFQAGVHDAAAFIARLKLEKGVDSAVGPAINITDSDPRVNYVALKEEHGLIGVYIREDQGVLFDFSSDINKIRSEQELKDMFPDRFEEEYVRAAIFLPSVNPS